MIFRSFKFYFGCKKLKDTSLSRNKPSPHDFGFVIVASFFIFSMLEEHLRTKSQNNLKLRAKVLL